MSALKKIVFAILCVALFSSCSSLRFSSRLGGNYHRSVPLAIIPYQDNTDSGASELLYLLQSHGYNLVAYDGPRTGYDRRPYGRSRYDGQYDTIYILDINCKLKPQTEDTYSSFRAILSDQKTGHIILTATLRGRAKDAKQTVTDLVRKMDRIIH